MRFVALCLLLSACGGKIDGDDGGSPGVDASVDTGTQKDGAPKPDVGPPPPPPPTCTKIQSQTAINSNGGCTSSASWSCGETKYSVQCTCPSAQCSCTQQIGSSGSGTVLQEPSFCPACNADEMPKICGFPTN